MAQPDYSSTNDRGATTFGRTLQKFISERLPYNSYSVVDVLSQLNPKFNLFQGTGSRRTEAIAKHSISSSTGINETSIGAIASDNSLSTYLYANIQADKGARIRDYRVMAAFSEVADALDEICDEVINVDDEGRIVKLRFHDAELTEVQREEIQKEFNRYVNLFEMENRGWEYFRHLLVDAEIYFEHIIHKDYPEDGILGVISIPPELIDPVFGNVQNLLVKGYVLRKPVFDKTNPTKVVDYQIVPLDKNQVTYINSGIWNENKTVRLPFLENARRAYRQLSLIEDSIVIYRLVRAPEKLVFNVDVGNMSPAKAEGYMRRLMQQYWSRKTFDVGQDATVQKFNPQSMLDSFWFAKRTGQEGTNVTQLQGGQNLGELNDLMYFLKKLYRSLKVPASRLNPEDTYKDGTEILREELKFSKFIIRQQQRFAEGLKNGFITNLKLKKMWSEYGLKENHFDLAFNVPTNFYEMRELQKMEMRTKSFNDITGNESISKMFMQKKVLGWTDRMVLANREFLRKDAELKWELDQIAGAGPEWRKQFEGGPRAKAPQAGGEETPPEFGPSPGGGTPTPEAPEAGAETPPETPPIPETPAAGGGETPTPA
ncbi:hypothetical protein EBR43_07925 [bacterium]|nr:hypothetical protein [bacterium]